MLEDNHKNCADGDGKGKKAAGGEVADWEGDNKGGKRRQSRRREVLWGLLPAPGSMVSYHREESCAPGRTEDIAKERRENIGYKGCQDHPTWPRNPTRYGTNVPLPTMHMFSSKCNQETDHNSQTQWHNMLHVCVNSDDENGDTIF